MVSTSQLRSSIRWNPYVGEEEGRLPSHCPGRGAGHVLPGEGEDAQALDAGRGGQKRAEWAGPLVEVGFEARLVFRRPNTSLIPQRVVIAGYELSTDDDEQ